MPLCIWQSVSFLRLESHVICVVNFTKWYHQIQKNFQTFYYCPINCTLKFLLKSIYGHSNQYKSCGWNVCLKSFSIKIWEKKYHCKYYDKMFCFFHQGKTFINESLRDEMGDFLDDIGHVYIDHFTFAGIYMYLNAFNYNKVNWFKTVVQYHILQLTLIPKIILICMYLDKQNLLSYFRFSS